jgi:hypothetical protein
MPSREDPSPLEDGGSSSDEDTIRGDPENGAVAELSEDERPATPVAIGNGSVANRYREILQEQREESFDDSSVDDAPRGVDSPIGSTLSVPDDAASLQVRSPSCSCRLAGIYANPFSAL